jgi:hypothetical protein
MGELSTPLKIGDVAPSIVRKDVLTGNIFNLTEIAKKHHGILINFFRGEF